MAERKGDCNRKFRSILAFFPVVAISSNLSTRFQDVKEIKKFQITKPSFDSQDTEYFFQVAIFPLKGKYRQVVSNCKFKQTRSYVMVRR